MVGQDNIQRLCVQLKTVQQVHKRVQKRLAAWWAEQSTEERKKFILVRQIGNRC